MASWAVNLKFSSICCLETRFQGRPKDSDEKMSNRCRYQSFEQDIHHQRLSYALKSEVIAAVQGRTRIPTIDGSNIFHQFLVSPEDRQKLTVISHGDHEQSNVVLTGYKNWKGDSVDAQ